jgi:hypothetical protein
LPAAGVGQWWQMTATSPQAFVLLLDIGKPVLTTIGDPSTLVRIGSEVADERTWAFRPDANFARVEGLDDPDETIWMHGPSGVELSGHIEQPIHPTQLLEAERLERQTLRSLTSFVFQRIDSATADTVDAVRR